MIKTGKAGAGTYGTVYNAKLGKDDETEIAVKRNIVDADISFSGSLREMDLLNRLRGHPFIVKLFSVTFGNPFVAPNSPIGNRQGTPYKEDYLHFVFEKGDKNLHNLIYEKTVHVSYLKLAMTQILLAIEFMHAKGVIHRDIKPANLLWFVDKNKKTSVKICDFGLSRVKTFQEPSSPGVVTCWYRAPEICYKSEKYSFSSDIWSAGCVFFEMIARKALLFGMKDDNDKLLSKIVSLMPSLSKEDKKIVLKNSQIDKESFQKHRKNWKSQISLSGKNIIEFNKYTNVENHYEMFLDLLDKMLKLNPDERPTATEALNHPFFSPYSNVIEWCRTNYPPNKKSEHNINIIDCIERKWAIQTAFTQFNERGSLSWYNHRVLFQSIDLFDRYLEHLSTTNGDKLIPSKLSGKYMTRHQSELRYMICLYMSIKYFSTLQVPVSFDEIVKNEFKTESALVESEQFEKKMLKEVLRFRVYRETIYEAADKLNIVLDEYKIRDLIYLYGKSGNRENLTPTDLLKELINIKVDE